MANAFVVTDLVASEVLRIAHEKCQFIGTVDRQYDDSFAQTGGKHGSTLRVKKPNQYTRRQGSRVMAVQDQDERASTVTVATQDGVDMRFNSAELIQSVNSGAAFNDLSKNYIQPAVCSLLSGIESDFIAFSTKATWNVAGTAGTPPADLVAVGAARAKLNQGLAPKDGNRYIQYDSVNMGTIVNGLKGLFQDSTQIKEQYREGMLGRTAMADWYENDRMWTLTNGSDVTGTTDAAALVTDGALSATNGLVVDIHTTIAAGTSLVGEVFTIAGVYPCHPETKAIMGSALQQFVIVTPGVGTGATTIAPQIFLTGPRQNVCSSTGAQLLTTSFNSQTLTFVGAASTSYVQNLMYHKEAFQFITADLPLMDDAQKCVRKTQDNLSVRVWMGSDIRNDELLMRLDILYGMAALRPEWASRITM
jgi:hypothetical protein